MPQKCKLKTCTDCHKTYIPTSNVQKRCPDCMKIKSHHLGTRTRKFPRPAAAKAPHPLGNDGATPAASRLEPSRDKAPLSLQGAVDLFCLLSDAGCTALVFGSTKISIEKV